MKTVALVGFFFLIVQSLSIHPGGKPNLYYAGDKINVKVNSMTSTKAHIPLEYYRAPFPKPKEYDHEKQTLFDMISQNHIESSVYDFEVMQNKKCVVVGDLYYNKDDLNQLSKLVEGEYLGHFIIDDLPVSMKVETANNGLYYEHGYPIGCPVVSPTTKKVESQALNNHLNFVVYYNQEQENSTVSIVGFEVSPKSMYHQSSSLFNENNVKTGILQECNPDNLPLSLIKTMDETTKDDTANVRTIFTYSVEWVQTDKPWAARFDVLLQHDPMRANTNVHWYTLANSALIVLLLTGLVVLILLRSLYQDFSHYNRLAIDEEAPGEIEEAGWKALHADVFRPPEHMKPLFAATIGCGFQMTLAMTVYLLISTLGYYTLNEQRSLFFITLCVYILAGFFGGKIAGRLYVFFEGKSFKFTFLLMSVFYPCIIFATILGMNSFSSFVGSAGSVSFYTFIFYFSIFIVCNMPLSFLGLYKGFTTPTITAPLPTSGIPREIPRRPWYFNSVLLYLIGGLIPFGVIFIECYFYLSSVWMNHIYSLYLYLFLSFLLLLVVSCELSIIVIYSLLCSEEYRWWWNSILIPGFSAVYFFILSSYFFLNSFQVNNLIAIVDCIGSTFIISVIFFLVTGFVGFTGCFYFIFAIYSNAKVQ
ncbi:hypothetical protein WA158_004337 [Blastocystis sp. Blastoise]